MKTYFTGKVCKHGHIAPRFISNGFCTECARGRRPKKRYQYPTRKSNEEASRRWHRLHPERRRVAVRVATPLWANKVKIREVYAERIRLNALGKQQYVVDHIIPLKGKLVCGLHIHENLQIITEESNATKHAKWS